jgi:hypothetical protein
MYRKVYKYIVPSLVHLSIDFVYLLWYNIYVIKDSPISTPPVVSPTSNTKEWWQHGKTANYKTPEGEKKNV